MTKTQDITEILHEQEILEKEMSILNDRLSKIRSLVAKYMEKTQR